jgi:polyhydroxybutyrate depolymerase
MSTPPRCRRRARSPALVAALVLLALALSPRAAVRADVTGPTGATVPRPASIIYRPPGLSLAAPVPLVIALYGDGGSPQNMEGQTHLEGVATEHGFVVAYPGSVTSPPWNSPNDLDYISSLIDQVVASQNIDASRVYVTGFSAGGRMAYYVGCMLSAKVAAVAAVSSVMRGYTCSLARPVSELTIIGGAETVLVNGRAPDFPSAATVASQWRALDGCPAGQPAVTQVGPVTQQTWGGCTSASAVGLYVVAGGRHYWPGQYGAPGPDAPGQYSASEAVWAFFAAHRAAAPPVPVSSRPPSTKGSAVVGRTLIASHGTWANTPSAYTYTWERCNRAGGACVAIAGATAHTYTLSAADVGSTIRIAESAGNVWGSASPARSRPTSVVKPAPPGTTLRRATVSSRRHLATFSFKAIGRATGFQCALVLKPTGRGARTPAPTYSKCGSTQTFTHLRSGSYRLYVRAVGPGGVGKRPATYSFTIN